MKDFKEFGTSEKPHVSSDKKKRDEISSYYFNLCLKLLKNKCKENPDIEAKYSAALKNVENINSYEELKQVLKEYPELKGWSIVNPVKGWIYFRTMRKPGENLFRLYLNLDERDRYDFFSFYINRCISKKMPVDAKTFEDDRESWQRADNVVIYCKKENIMGNIEILKEYKEKNPDVVKRSFPPAVMAATIMDGWIGFSQNPKEDKFSYSSIRRDLVNESIEQSIIEFVKENRENRIFSVNKIDGEGKELLTVKQYIIGYIKANEPYKAKSIEKVEKMIDNIHAYKNWDEMPININPELCAVLQSIMNSSKYSKPMIQRVRRKIKENSKSYDVSSDNFIFNADYCLGKKDEGRG